MNTLAFAFVSRERTNYATGLINLARNIGGSAGIAMVGTMLARRARFHQANLIGHLTPMDPAYNSMLNGTAQILMSKGSDSAQAMQQSHGILYGMVQQQAMMKAFIDNFWLLGVIFLAVIPLMFLTKTIQGHKTQVVGH